MTTFVFLLGCEAANAKSQTYWLYCEATRQDDGAKVMYEFEISGEVARTSSGNWQISEKAKELRLSYVWPDGKVDEGAIILINRLTGELFHNAYGISIYQTQPGDQPCERRELRF